MKLSSGRMPLGVKSAFVLAVALLFQGVTCMSIRSTAATSAPVSLGVANPSVADDHEKEETLDENELDADEPKMDSDEADRDDDSLEYDETVSLDKIGATESPKDTMKEDANEEGESEVEASPKENRGAEINILERENPTDLSDALNFISLIAKRAAEELEEEEEEEMMSSDDDALNFIRLVAKRAAEEEEAVEGGKSVDEDSFLFTDLPKILGPLLKAFSSAPENSDAPSPDDFFSWFPDLKKLLEDPKPTDRRSYLPTSPQPPLQIAPASPQPTGSEVLREVSASTAQPTIPEPPQTSQASLPGVPDSEERFY
ncbi:proline-, glutamic acid- and leucine-rich protein 1-like [Lacerta agilis]|uniref:proline-, glutamic acid- and leucine-rich protein 1-like n=1 Tax=Lacerta agilis TaxID=80427 RepID=UPI001419FBA0|nr:proline-, glutamic acid- and leucine-rich protein 1-like [Lacerta agilis]